MSPFVHTTQYSVALTSFYLAYVRLLISLVLADVSRFSGSPFLLVEDNVSK